MPKRWLQIKGDPAIRAQLFQQKRVESLFDRAIDRIHDIVSSLMTQKGVFHVKIHYSSSQLTCWFSSDPFVFQKFVREEIIEPNFLDNFSSSDYAGRESLLNENEIARILAEFKRIRLSDETVYLRSGAINLINGMINMSFSCDGTHYIDYKSFFENLDKFESG